MPTKTINLDSLKSQNNERQQNLADQIVGELSNFEDVNGCPDTLRLQCQEWKDQLKQACIQALAQFPHSIGKFDFDPSDNELRQQAEIIETRNVLLRDHFHVKPKPGIDAWQELVKNWMNARSSCAAMDSSAQELSQFKLFTPDYHGRSTLKPINRLIAQIAPYFIQHLLELLSQQPQRYSDLKDRVLGLTQPPSDHLPFCFDQDLTDNQRFINFDRSLWQTLKDNLPYIEFKEFRLQGTINDAEGFVDELYDLFNNMRNSPLGQVTLVINNPEQLNSKSQELNQLTQLLQDHERPITTTLRLQDSEGRSLKEDVTQSFNNAVCRHRRRINQQRLESGTSHVQGKVQYRYEPAQDNEDQLLIGRDEKADLAQLSAEIECQEQEQQQQQSQAQQSQASGANDEELLDPGGLISKGEFCNQYRYMLTQGLENPKSIEYIPGQLYGSHSHPISYLTSTAFHQILDAPWLYYQGLNPEHLPHGFYIRYATDKHWVLDFDRFNAPAPDKPSAYRPKLNSQRETPSEYAGDDRQFGLDKDQEYLGSLDQRDIKLKKKRTRLVELLKNSVDNESQQQRITEVQKAVISKLSGDHIANIKPVLYEYGIEGVLRLLEAFQAFDTDRWKKFNNWVLQDINSWLNLMDQTTLKVIHRLAGSYQNTWQLLLRLLEQTPVGLKTTSIADITHAVETFAQSHSEHLEDLGKIDGPLQIDAWNNQRFVQNGQKYGNPLVILDRLDAILTGLDRENRKTFLNELNKLPLTIDGPYQAVHQEHFKRIWLEMEFGNKKRNEPYIKNIIDPNQQNIYTIDVDNIRQFIKYPDQIDQRNFVTALYRYLGRCETVASRAYYKNAFDCITLHGDNDDSQDRRYFQALITVATTHANAALQHVDDQSPEVLSCVLSDQIKAAHDGEAKIPWIMEPLFEWTVSHQLNLQDLTGLMELLTSSNNPSQFKTNYHQLKNIMEADPRAVLALCRQRQNMDDQCRPGVDDLATSLSDLRQSKLIANNVVLQKYLVQVLGVMQLGESSGSTSDLREVIDQTSPAVLSRILRLLARLDPARSSPQLIIEDLQAIIQRKLDTQDKLLEQYSGLRFHDTEQALSQNDLKDCFQNEIDELTSILRNHESMAKQFIGPQSYDQIMSKLSNEDFLGALQDLAGVVDRIPVLIKSHVTQPLNNALSAYKAQIIQDSFANVKDAQDHTVWAQIPSVLAQCLNTIQATELLAKVEEVQAVKQYGQRLAVQLNTLAANYSGAFQRICAAVAAIYGNGWPLDFITRLLESHNPQQSATADPLPVLEAIENARYRPGTVEPIRQTMSLSMPSQAKAELIRQLFQLATHNDGDNYLETHVQHIKQLLPDPARAHEQGNLPNILQLTRTLIANNYQVDEVISSNLVNIKHQVDQQSFQGLLAQAVNYPKLLQALVAANSSESEIEPDKLGPICRWLSKISVTPDQYESLWKLINQLKQCDTGLINDLVQLYQRGQGRGQGPSIDTIEQQLIENDSSDLQQKLRDLILKQSSQSLKSDNDERFDDSQALRVLNDMTHLQQGKGVALRKEHKKQLLRDFYFVNGLGGGHKSNYYLPPLPDKPQQGPINRMLDSEIRYALDAYRDKLNQQCDEAQRHTLMLTCLALAREVMYRQTGRFPHSTQMLSVLHRLHDNSDYFAEIKTGQGKSIITALYATTLWLQGYTVDVCTSNQDLAKRDLEHFGPYFDALGIPRKSDIVRQDSDLDSYQCGGINYTEVSQMAIFREQKRTQNNWPPVDNYRPALVLDEADYTIFDDRTYYRYAKNFTGETDTTQHAWIYEAINDYIDDPSAPFPRTNLSLASHAYNLRQYLWHHEQCYTEWQQQVVANITDLQCVTWLESAYRARLLVRKTLDEQTTTYFRIKPGTFSHNQQNQDEQTPSQVELLGEDGRPSPKARWSDGVHQFVHARLNKRIDQDQEQKQNDEQWRIPKFKVEPEKAPIASITSGNFLSYYQQNNGKITGLTGTLGGSEEQDVLTGKLNASCYRMPTHQINRRHLSSEVVKDEAKQVDYVFDVLKKRAKRSNRGHPVQPVLVHCSHIEHCEWFFQQLKDRIAKDRQTRQAFAMQLYHGRRAGIWQYHNGQDLQEYEAQQPESAITEQAGLAGTITVSTLMGRGTDISPQFKDNKGNKQPHPQGLLGINLTPTDLRTKAQREGRTARQDDKGEHINLSMRQQLHLPEGSKGWSWLPQAKNQAKSWHEAEDEHAQKASQRIVKQRAHHEDRAEIDYVIYLRKLRLANDLAGQNSDAKEALDRHYRHLLSIMERFKKQGYERDRYIEKVQQEWNKQLSDITSNYNVDDTIARYQFPQGDDLLNALKSWSNPENQPSHNVSGDSPSHQDSPLFPEAVTYSASYRERMAAYQLGPDKHGQANQEANKEAFRYLLGDISKHMNHASVQRAADHYLGRLKESAGDASFNDIASELAMILMDNYFRYKLVSDQNPKQAQRYQAIADDNWHYYARLMTIVRADPALHAIVKNEQDHRMSHDLTRFGVNTVTNVWRTIGQLRTELNASGMTQAPTSQQNGDGQAYTDDSGTEHDQASIPPKQAVKEPTTNVANQAGFARLQRYLSIVEKRIKKPNTKLTNIINDLNTKVEANSLGNINAYINQQIENLNERSWRDKFKALFDMSKPGHKQLIKLLQQAQTRIQAMQPPSPYQQLYQTMEQHLQWYDKRFWRAKDRQSVVRDIRVQIASNGQSQPQLWNVFNTVNQQISQIVSGDFQLNQKWKRLFCKRHTEKSRLLHLLLDWRERMLAVEPSLERNVNSSPTNSPAVSQQAAHCEPTQEQPNATAKRGNKAERIQDQANALINSSKQFWSTINNSQKQQGLTCH